MEPPRRFAVDDAGSLMGPGVVQIPSPMRYARLSTGEPIGVLWHFTGGAATPGSGLSLARQISRKGKRGASWHVIVTREGSVIQSVPFLCGAWHCAVGHVSHAGLEHTPNRSLIGIELENAGELRRHNGHFFRWSPRWIGLGDPQYLVPSNRATSAGAKVWDDFPPEQVAAARELIRALVERYAMPVEHLRHGHRDFDPARRPDPGDLWVDEHLPRVLAGIGGVNE